MTAPRVSVVIPTYNRARFLPAAIASVRAQTRPCAEIVVVDDGSTDGTAELVSTLGAGIVYVLQDNQGPSAARNRGIREACGELIAFLDTDDRWLPDKLARQVDLIAARPSIALVATDEAMEDGDGKTLVASNFARRRLVEQLRLDGHGRVTNAPGVLLRVNFISTSTVLARRDVLLELDGFDRRLRYGEDLELWLRIAARHDVGCLTSVEAIRVTHDANTTKSIEPMLRGYVELAEVIRAWAGPAMAGWGVDGDAYVARALADLGYWHFSCDQPRPARQAFARSLREAFTLRAAVYGMASWLPPAVVRMLRRAKPWNSGRSAA
ncbi:hypothetical protein CLD22_00055 [Rubrivivax gelatinosus]|nr:hypothetical protein [Rubrivivax gelatinosus]